jgi:hypothetical protein
MKKMVKIVVTVPESHTEVVRQAMGDAGAGVIGKYHHCCAIVKQVGYSIPDEGANPTIGTIGKLEKIIEDRIEAPVEREKLKQVAAAIRQVHPYEEPVIDAYPLLNIDELD